MKKKCVFLDRDGVLNRDDQYYTYKLEDLVLLDGVAEALRLLKEAGYLLIVITNQAGIAKGLYTGQDVRVIHARMQELTGVAFDDLYFASHHPDYTSRSLTRKPDSLLIEKAMAKYHIDPALSWMVGDHARDMQAGRKAGVHTIHIVAAGGTSAGDYAAPSLLEAARIILQNGTEVL
ncbi:hypothetical protein GCM10027275_00980 [Rhabdobacter roseus]|uniref:D,D-heptose 1,7-bisphosphate phosphatase n=1 Tax=Rhabdobacter roseus TaxID=1655419 RepID=A0A840TKA2_9BACT|nr:HAD family hydrolase [Rhabdobacter roseus]MBB5281982.1 D-glycero-D-manno-heptose 1,7-bisphosphate phosphatase [Rhabdobacter roseus]